MRVANAIDLTTLSSELDYLSARDMILSQNVANADTPKYLPKDLRKPVDLGNNLELSVTNPGHLQINKIPNYNVYDSEILEMKPNGNAVTLEHELYKKSENALHFNETSQIYSKARGMLKNSFGSGR